VLGAISIFCTLDRGVVAPYFPGHRNIRIENNRITGCPTAGIYAFGVDGLIVTGNTLERVMTAPAVNAGTAVGLDLKEPIDVRHATNATVSGNTVR
jgi:parallel beta-helix repeat protein